MAFLIERINLDLTVIGNSWIFHGKILLEICVFFFFGIHRDAICGAIFRISTLGVSIEAVYFDEKVLNGRNVPLSFYAFSKLFFFLSQNMNQYYSHVYFD